jgi:hypothetical protein
MNASSCTTNLQATPFVKTATMRKENGKTRPEVPKMFEL